MGANREGEGMEPCQRYESRKESLSRVGAYTRRLVKPRDASARY